MMRRSTVSDQRFEDRGGEEAVCERKRRRRSRREFEERERAGKDRIIDGRVSGRRQWSVPPARVTVTTLSFSSAVSQNPFSGIYQKRRNEIRERSKVVWFLIISYVPALESRPLGIISGDFT
jgi:hypothetical protein